MFTFRFCERKLFLQGFGEAHRSVPRLSISPLSPFPVLGEGERGERAGVKFETPSTPHETAAQRMKFKHALNQINCRKALNVAVE